MIVKNKILSLLSVIVLILAIICFNIYAEDTTAEGEVSGGSIAISTLAELAEFRDNVNAGTTYEGYVVSLVADITLDGEWTPIGNAERSGKSYSGNAFKGTFSGGGHTISGLSITTGSSSSAVGLFGVIDGAVIGNLRLDSVSISTESNNAGSLVGLMVGGSTVSDVTVCSGNVVAPDGVGGIVGRMTVSGSIIGSTSSASVEATSTGGAGGIVGKAYYTELNKVMTIMNCTNTGAVRSAYAAGGIAGLCAADISGCSNSGEIVGGVEAGGIVGEQVNRGVISSNTNTASVVGEGTAAGGIVGWIRYQADEVSYPLSELIAVLENKNTADVSCALGNGSLGYGGIVGTVYNQAMVARNESTASSVVGGTFASGIVGGAQVSEDNLKLDGTTVTVYNNVSTTPIENLSASCVDLFVWNNDASFAAGENSSSWVATIGEVKYATLNGAFSEAEGAHTVKLISDVYLTECAVANNSEGITLDLNGCEISVGYQEGSEDRHIYAITNNGTLNLIDSAEGGAVLARGIYNYGAMTVDSGRYSAIDSNGGAGVFNYGELTVNGGSFDGYCSVNNQAGGVCEVNYISATSADWYSINNVGSMVIYDADIIGGFGAVWNNGELEIKNGYFECTSNAGGHAFYTAGGNTTIENGEFIPAKDGYSYGIVTNGDCTVTVNGGSFDSGLGGSVAVVDAGQVVVNGGAFSSTLRSGGIEGAITLYGGTYGEKPSGVADGYLLAMSSADNTYTVIENIYFTYIGEDIRERDGYIAADIRFSYDFADGFVFTSWSWEYYAEANSSYKKSVNGVYITEDNITRLVITDIGIANYEKNVCAEMSFELMIDGVSYTVYDAVRTASVYNTAVAQGSDYANALVTEYDAYIAAE